jgi:hypothetical protein
MMGGKPGKIARSALAYLSPAAAIAKAVSRKRRPARPQGIGPVDAPDAAPDPTSIGRIV